MGIERGIHLFLKLNIIYLAIPAILSAGIPVNHLHHFIESPKLSHWGEWGKLEHCPSDQVVIGMRLKVHEHQGVKDDTGLNAVKFYCQNPYSTAEYTSDIISIASLIGNAGDWKKEFFCPITPEGKHVAVGFQLRSEKSAGVKDDTAGNNLKLVCSDLYQKRGYSYLEGDGTAKGEWTKQQLCSPGYAICGLQTQVEMSRSMDTTGLNNLKVRCCKADSSVNNANSTRSGGNTTSSEKGIHSSEFHHRSDHLGEGLGYEDSQNTPAEQELTAIEDNPNPEQSDFLTNESFFPLDPPSDGQPIPSEEERELTTSYNASEDETLPEAIAEIDQVDNSEAHDDIEKPATTTFTQDIPQHVVNALEDVDSPASQNEEDEQAISEAEDGDADGDGEYSKNFSEDEDLSLFTNYKESNERTNFHMQDSDESSDFEEQQQNAYNDEAEASPKSSPHYGQSETVNKTNVEAAATGSASPSRLSNWHTLGFGYLIMLLFVKLI